MNLLTGIALLVGYPTKALTNPVFYLKLGLIATGLVILRAIFRRMGSGQAAMGITKVLAAALLIAWIATITTGRLLAHTHTAVRRLRPPMIPFQVELESALRSFTQVAALMRTNWGWPIAESIHFVGLTLLFGSIAAWTFVWLAWRSMCRLRHSTVSFRSRFWDSRSTQEADRSS